MWPHLQRPVLLYDADCGFCTRSAGWTVPLGCEVSIASWQSWDIAAVGITPEQADERVHLVSSTGVLTGHEAIAAALRTSRRWWVKATGWLLARRAMAPLGSLAYATVAANRFRLPGGTAACRIDSPERPA